MLVIKIRTGNDAFAGDNLWPELTRIFDKICISAGQGELPVKLFDINGNHVGDIDWV